MEGGGEPTGEVGVGGVGVGVSPHPPLVKGSAGDTPVRARG